MATVICSFTHLFTDNVIQMSERAGPPLDPLVVCLFWKRLRRSFAYLFHFVLMASYNRWKEGGPALCLHTDRLPLNLFVNGDVSGMRVTQN